MNKQKLLATLISGGIALSTMTGLGGMVLADNNDTTGPSYQIKFQTRRSDNVHIYFSAGDEAGVKNTTATVYKTSEGPESAQTLSIDAAIFAGDFTLDGSGEEYTVITTATDNNDNTTVKKLAYDPTLGKNFDYTVFNHIVYTQYTIVNDHLYIRYDQGASWTAAEDYCRRLGGHLVSIGSAEESDLVINLIQDTSVRNPSGSYYIGFTDEDSEGTWSWTDGSEVTFTKWGGNEPNGGIGENWGHYYTNSGYWNDTQHGMGFGFVAEIDLSAIKEQKFTNEFDFENYDDNKFYSEYTFLSPTSWDVAQILLNSKDENFLKIESEEENAFLRATLAEAGLGAAYIGLIKDPAGEYFWSDGTQADYVNLADADPYESKYAVICNSEDGKWHLDEGLAEGVYGTVGLIMEKELPTPTVSPTPTATPEPTATPVPATATPTVTPTSEPTATPVPATATPTAVPTTEPTVTTAPTATATTAPTATAEPTATTVPTEEPTVAPTEEATPTPTVDPSIKSKAQIMDFVERIYIYVLDREPEEEGAAYWSNELWEFKRTGAEVAQGFIFSPEFESRNTTDDQFVEILYKTFFGRDSEPEGKAFWLEQLSTGTMDRVAVANGFIFSQEWADTCASYGIRSGGDIKPSGDIAPTELTYAFVERMYTTAMCRDYDENGRQYWASELANFNITGEQVGAMFFLSDEMTGYNLNNDDYLERLYKTFMDRDSDADGKAYWLGFMKDGHTREEVVYGFTRSPEFTAKCVEARILPY